MDIKGDNIFVASDGSWVLGDFGSTVKVGDKGWLLHFLFHTNFIIVKSYTEMFYPEKIKNTDACVQYDWYMLVVCILIEVKKTNWKDALMDASTHCVSRSKVDNIIQTLSPQLKAFCMELIVIN